ncbi:MAG: hypothetical protein Q9187_006761 [Circinaria calcarea]
MPTAAIARDPAYFSEPDEFRPWRFANLRRSSPTEAARHQFTSTGASSLAFGHGRFSCPGRFFAAAQIKLLLARLLVDFNVSYPEGQAQRPANLYIDERIAPDQRQVLRFRRLEK